MSAEADLSKMSVEEMAVRFRGEMIPLTGKFSYFCTLPMAEEDLRHYLHDPVAALSPAAISTLPRTHIILAPYLERGNGKSGDAVSFERPAEGRALASARRELEGTAVLALGIKDIEVADYHYQFYNALAIMIADHLPAELQERFN